MTTTASRGETPPPTMDELHDDVPDLVHPMAEPPKVPLTLLTGYLGAGKSTLLEYILTAQHGYRIAVCMNDFGDTTDIESKSLTLSNPSDPDAPSTQLLALPNGCLCCSVKDMGIAAIEEMARNERVDWVVVELTGLADPGPVAKSFWANEEMGELVLDGVVCVVDSRNVLKQLADTSDEVNMSQRQIAQADVILLNKLDLVSPAQLAEVSAAVQRINPTLRVHETTRSAVPLASIFGLHAYATAPPALDAADAHAHADDVHAHAHDPSPTHDGPCASPHAHPSAVQTALLALATLSAARFAQLEKFLQAVLWSSTFPDGRPVDADVLRTKGYVRVAAHDQAETRAYVVQGVADLFDIKAVDDDGTGQGKIVFIGRDVGGIVDELRRVMDL
ncbi:hypothetical protein Q5752_004757 [Cryptotrichosporon argae]